jgi:hypothetical protein
MGGIAGILQVEEEELKQHQECEHLHKGCLCPAASDRDTQSETKSGCTKALKSTGSPPGSCPGSHSFWRTETTPVNQNSQILCLAPWLAFYDFEKNVETWFYWKVNLESIKMMILNGIHSLIYSLIMLEFHNYIWILLSMVWILNPQKAQSLWCYW